MFLIRRHGKGSRQTVLAGSRVSPIESDSPRGPLYQVLGVFGLPCVPWSQIDCQNVEILNSYWLITIVLNFTKFYWLQLCG